MRVEAQKEALKVEEEADDEEEEGDTSKPAATQGETKKRKKAESEGQDGSSSSSSSYSEMVLHKAQQRKLSKLIYPVGSPHKNYNPVRTSVSAESTPRAK